MSDILCVTCRKLCREPFLKRIEKIARAQPQAIILREKDLTDTQYEALVHRVLPMLEKHGVPLVLNGHASLAKQLGLAAQLPFAQREMLSSGGVSIHSVEEAAVLCGSQADWLVLGHIWETTCKAGLVGRGTAFLRAVTAVADRPVYAIGGVTPARMQEIYLAGAAGACVMSTLMTCDDPEEYLAEFEGQKR